MAVRFLVDIGFVSLRLQSFPIDFLPSMNRGKLVGLLLRFPYYGPYDGSLDFPLRVL